MWAHQIEEASRFRQAHKDKLDSLEAALLVAVEAFVSQTISQVLKPETLVCIREDLASGDPSRYARTLRFEAAEITKTLFSHPYWLAIDALNFFSDAVGAHWPYMDDVRRGRSIAFAKEELQQLQKWLQENPSPVAYTVRKANVH